jgi:hypothetical protein
MEPWQCHFLFCAYWVAIRWLWIAASKSRTNNLIYKTKNCGHSIDAWGIAALTQTILPTRLPILSLWVNAIAQPMDYTRCNTQNHWNSVDAQFPTGDVTMSLSHLFRMAANTLIRGKCRSTALGLHKMQYPKLFTLCWHSVDAVLMLCWCSVDALLTLCWRSFWGVAVLTHTILPIQADNTSNMGKCESTAHGLYKMQYTRWAKLCWHSISDWGCDHVAFSFTHNGCQYLD